MITANLKLSANVLFLFFICSCRLFYSGSTDKVHTDGRYSIIGTSNGDLRDSCMIKGFVFDRRTNSPLAYTYIFIPELKRLSETDTSGYFWLIFPPGHFTIEAKRVGNYTLETDTLEFKPNSITEIKFELGSVVEFETKQ